MRKPGLQVHELPYLYYALEHLGAGRFRATEIAILLEAVQGFLTTCTQLPSVSGALLGGVLTP